MGRRPWLPAKISIETASEFCRATWTIFSAQGSATLRRQLSRWIASMSYWKNSPALSNDDWQAYPGEDLSRRSGKTKNWTSFPNSREPLKPMPLIRDAESMEVLELFLKAGEPLGRADSELRRRYIGLSDSAPLNCSRKPSSPTISRAVVKQIQSSYNPEFLEAMVRSGCNAYTATEMFSDSDFIHPVWCYDRHGHSLTPCRMAASLALVVNMKTSMMPTSAFITTC